MTSPPVQFSVERDEFHKKLTDRLLVFNSFTPQKGSNKGIVQQAASNADAENSASREIANSIARALGAQPGQKLAAQSSGAEFETAVCSFLKKTFFRLKHLRPGKWDARAVSSRTPAELGTFEQYSHLEEIAKLAKSNPEIAIALGSDYVVAPDVIVTRHREPDSFINANEPLVDGTVAKAASLREANGRSAILHASISCKWTIRSDRAQNSRSEALNLLRNRKSRAPHIVVVTGERLPSRLSSLALGTGDLDCVYHFALYELIAGVQQLGQSEAFDLLNIMVEGRRLKDISDLPLDLCV